MILMDYSDQGSLQDAINVYLKVGKRMDETLAIYYTIEMLKILEILHKAGIIHGDIKPDNFLIKNHPVDVWEEWDSHTRAGWDAKGLILIDFGRSIDTTLYPPNAQFYGDYHVSGFKCREMEEGRPWTFQTDYYGLCGVIHCLLHGSYMQTVRDPRTNEWKPKEPFKRYWQGDLWKPLFRDLLNVGEKLNIEAGDRRGGRRTSTTRLSRRSSRGEEAFEAAGGSPSTSTGTPMSMPNLAHHRQTFENYLRSHLAKAKAVKSLLVKQNIMLYES